MFQQMTTFVRIAEMGSITRAARSLGLSLPMASRHLRWLEEELGAVLVHRTTRQLHLTAAGQEFATRSRTLLLGLEGAKQALRTDPSLVGRVVVTAPGALGTCQLSSVIVSLVSRHPHLQIDLRLEDRAVDLVKEGVDLAIRAAAPPDHASLVARELASYDRVVCAAPAFVARHGQIDSVAALATLPCIVHGSGPSVWEFETLEGRQPITVNGPLSSNNVVIIREAVLAGLGIAWLPAYVIGDDLRNGQLIRLVPAASLPPIRVFGIMPKQARQNATVKAVRNIVGAALRAQAAKLRS